MRQWRAGNPFEPIPWCPDPRAPESYSTSFQNLFLPAMTHPGSLDTGPIDNTGQSTPTDQELQHGSYSIHWQIG